MIDELIQKAIETRCALRVGDLIISPQRVTPYMKQVPFHWELWTLEQCEKHLRAQSRRNVDQMITALMYDLYPEVWQFMSFKHVEITPEVCREVINKIGIINPEMTLAELSKKINQPIFWILGKI